MIHTYSQPFQSNNLIFEMSKESAQIYNKAIQLHKDGAKFDQIGKIIDDEFKTSYLQSQSRQASYQQYVKDFKAYTKALKAFNIDPKNFSGEPKPPHKERFLKTIYFKESAIRFKDGELILSVKKPNQPIKVRWNKDLGIPNFVTITYDVHTGWKINIVVESKDPEQLTYNTSKVMSIDLGVKRIATTFDGINTKTYSGKEFIALNQLRNKLLAKTQSKYANTKKDSRRRKYLKRAYRRNCQKIKNKEKDILHKYSRQIVNDATENKIDIIVIGDCSNIHNKTNLGVKNNQKIQQNPEQKLKDYVSYKFQSTGKSAKVASERRTSKTCPRCNHVHERSPKGRTFVCKECGFTFDRDGVGSVNIYRLEVSFNHVEWLDVIGRLTRPLGVKYRPNLSCRHLKDVCVS